MSAKARELLERWRTSPPAEVPLSDVDLVLDAFLAGCVVRAGGKEPRIIEHVWLRVVPGCELGVASIAAVKGRRVKRIYVKKLVLIIDFLNWARQGLPNWGETRPLPVEVYERYEQERR